MVVPPLEASRRPSERPSRRHSNVFRSFNRERNTGFSFKNKYRALNVGDPRSEVSRGGSSVERRVLFLPLDRSTRIFKSVRDAFVTVPRCYTQVAGGTTMSFLFQAVLALRACLLVGTVLSAPATYDQRQTGDYNVRIDLKDLKIVAFLDAKTLEDYTDYDYFYDYADFTIKPTTSKTTTSSTAESLNVSTDSQTSLSTTNEIGSVESVFPANDSTTTSSLSSVEDRVTALKPEISTESTEKSTVEDKMESSSSTEGIVETPKSSLSRGTTKWRSSNRSKFESPSG